jgi:hypothetical protein
MYLLSSDARNKHYSLGDLIGRTEPAEGKAVGAVVISLQLQAAIRIEIVFLSSCIGLFLLFEIAGHLLLPTQIVCWREHLALD